MSGLNKNPLNERSSAELAGGLAVSQVPGWKRALDVTCILLTAPVWVPLGVTIGIVIKMVSPGPALFRQERVGHMGRRFNCLKFRSMKVNADPGVHREHLTELMTRNETMKKLDAADKRLIPGGLLLRTVGLDELPQLINVLRGEMSLVGPRPSLAYEYEMYEPHHRQRCHTLPGLTGLWQVSGKNQTTFARMMELDLEYVKNRSLGLDLKILVCTVPAILKQVYDVRQGRKAISHASGVENVRQGQARSESTAVGGPKGNGKAPSTTGSRLVASPRAGL
jgi:lipopolysaccharide/colanic/teichoic acid biosynthesis glycosyltransferase